MQLQTSEICERIPRELKPMIEKAAIQIAEIGTRSGEKVSEWIDNIIDTIF